MGRKTRFRSYELIKIIERKASSYFLGKQGAEREKEREKFLKGPLIVAIEKLSRLVRLVEAVRALVTG